MKWLPKDMGGLFFDGIDYRGILYWYEIIKAKNKKS